MRTFVACALATAFLAAATAASAEEQKCSLIKATSVQMIRSFDNQDILPVTISGKKKYFLLSTADARTEIGRPAVEDLNLAFIAGVRGLIGIAGEKSTDAARIPEFDIGNLGRANLIFPISPGIGIDPGTWYDGALAPEYLQAYDVDVDFGSDVFNLFSQDHCPGGVVYWQAPAVAVLPIIQRDNYRMAVSLTLDGQKFEALVDTGAAQTILRSDHAENLFGLSMGSTDTPTVGLLNGNKSLPIYRHTFKSMTLDGIAINNPKVILYPGTVFGNSPDMVLGMDVLRKLHVYFALREGKMYVTPASVQTPEQKALQASLIPAAAIRAAMPGRIAVLNRLLADHPDDFKALNNRCFFKATIKSDLAGALTDCDRSVKLKPGDPYDLDSRAFVLYQQGKYQDAVAGYDAALVANPKQAQSLFMRGHAKGKLGDAAGMQADIAAAKAIKPDVEDEFRVYDVDL